MKKIIISIIIILLLLTCVYHFLNLNNKGINDPTTGDIKRFSIDNNYIDGTYEALGLYFDSEGKFPYMRIKVDNGIITFIEFDYIYNNNQRYSAIFANEEDSMNYTIKSLNNSLLQEQKEIKANSDFDVLNNDYNNLLNTILDKALTGDTHIKQIDLDITYSAKLEYRDSQGYYSSLDVEYENGIIKNIKFLEINDSMLSKNSNTEFLEEFQNKNDITYSSFVENMIKISKNCKKIKLVTETNETAARFNQLSDIINTQRVLVNLESNYSSNID